MNRVLEADASLNLQAFCAYLWRQGVPNRVFEERGRQVLAVAHAEHSALVQEAFAAWQSGQLQLASPAPVATRPGLLLSMWRLPVLSLTCVLAILVFPFSLGLDVRDINPLIAALLVVRLDAPMGSGLSLLLHTLQSLELWRLVTPILLHFSAVHLLFNIALCVEFGRRIELAAGSLQLLLLLLLLAVISNSGQLLFSGYPLFGGLSGVVYGLFGFVLVRGHQLPAHPAWQLNTAFAAMLVIFLVLMSTGITAQFGLNIANAAHWSGFLAGMALAWLQRPATDSQVEKQ